MSGEGVEAGKIVTELAVVNPPIDELGYCMLCGSGEGHASACAWARAVEWVKEYRQ